MDVLANYSFLPWMKTGLSTKINEQDNQSGTATPTPSALPRPTIDISVLLNNTVAHTELAQIIGPGEILGIRPEVISRAEPKNDSNNLLPNYVPFIEFYDEDFPWRYTPAMPATAAQKKLTPWLTLLVLTDSEFTLQPSIDGKLPFITVLNKSNLPEPGHQWAFAHVHVSDQVVDGTGGNAKVDHVRSNSPDRIYSRILCSRKLAADTKYTAFLVPTFELGRQAGIDPTQQPSVTDVMNFAWNTSTGTVNLPIYHDWSFSTASAGDFEELAKKLKPRNLPASVGKQVMDIRDMGYGVNGQVAIPLQEAVGLKMGGALKAPNTSLAAWENNTEKQNFEAHLTGMLNQTTTNQSSTGWTAGSSWPTNSPDPVVGPPMYGRWHAKHNKINSGTPYWMTEINLTPRNRAAAGLGAEIVRKNQEEFVRRAWEQVGDVLEANEDIRNNYLALLASQQAFAHSFVHMPDDDFLRVTGAAHARTLVPETGGGSGMESARKRVNDSNLPAAAETGSMSKIVNRNSRISKRANGLVEGLTGSEYQRTILTNLNSTALTHVTSAEAKHDPSNFLSVNNQLGQSASLVQSIISNPSQNYAFTVNNGSNGVANYNAFQDFQAYYTSAPTATPAAELDFNDTRAAIESAMDPTTVMIDRMDQFIDQDGVSTTIQAPILCEPTIPIALSGKLKEISNDFLVPNMGQFQDNTVSMLETNQEFIESLMVGANHEMARELLWREYPTDQRGTYFSQFWRTLNTSFTNYGELADEFLTQLDIKRITDWPDASYLGDVSHRPDGSVDSNLVLIVRGELLRKFPNAMVYARPADVRRDTEYEFAPGDFYENLDTNGNSTKVRGFLDNDVEKFLYPTFRSQIDPDTLLLGFNLTALEAFGALANGNYPEQPDPQNPIDHLGGYYFVFQEREGDIRFGLDTGSASGIALTDWNNATWKDFNVDNDGEYLNPTSGPLAGTNFPATPPYDDTHNDVAWNQSSADAAYVLYQPPVYVAMHASRLLFGLYP